MPNAEKVVITTGPGNMTNVLVVDTPVNATYAVAVAAGQNGRKVRVVTGGNAEKMYLLS